MKAFQQMMGFIIVTIYSTVCPDRAYGFCLEMEAYQLEFCEL